MDDERWDVASSYELSASAEEVWRGLTQPAQATFAHSELKSVTVAETSDGRRLVDYVAWLKGFELRWQEEQLIDVLARRLEFRQTQGFFTTFAGVLCVEPAVQGCRVSLSLRLDLGMPYLSEFVNPVLRKAFREYYEGWLRTLARRPCPQARAGADNGLSLSG